MSTTSANEPIPLRVWVFLCHLAENPKCNGWPKQRAEEFIDESELPMVEEGKIVTIHYSNHRGERAVRRIQVIEFVFGVSDFHPSKRYFCKALDLDKGQVRDFALSGIHEWREHADAVAVPVPGMPT